jgi:TP53 regulating kinase and related kinases
MPLLDSRGESTALILVRDLGLKSIMVELSKLSAIEFSPVLGAEARLDLFDWYGKPAIRKSRIPKAYRIEQLDKILRTRRTKEEMEILHAAKLVGVDCPEVYFADPEASEIIMEFVPGLLLKEIYGSSDTVFRRVGQYSGRLHSKGIIHGDLTTKNMILSGERLVFIDFGLAFFSDRIEDRAEDLHLLKQVLKTETSLKKAMSNFEATLDGYTNIVGKNRASEVKSQIAKIELRGRYAQVD